MILNRVKKCYIILITFSDLNLKNRYVFYDNLISDNNYNNLNSETNNKYIKNCKKVNKSGDIN